MYLSLIATVITATITALSTTMAYAETVIVHGSTTVEANLFQPHQAALEAATGDSYTVVANGSSRGIQGLDTGAAHVGMISSGLEGTIAKVDVTNPETFYGEQVGEAIATYAVHPTNAVTALSKEQIVGILTGNITNWSQVGGADLPIIVVTEYDGGGLRDTIEKAILDKTKITDTARAMPNAPQIAEITKQLPNAFATVTTAMLKEHSDIKRVQTDADVVQPLILVIKGEQTPAFQRLTAAAKAVLQ